MHERSAKLRIEKNVRSLFPQVYVDRSIVREVLVIRVDLDFASTNYLREMFASFDCC